MPHKVVRTGDPISTQFPGSFTAGSRFKLGGITANGMAEPPVCGDDC